MYLDIRFSTHKNGDKIPTAVLRKSVKKNGRVTHEDSGYLSGLSLETLHAIRDVIKAGQLASKSACKQASKDKDTLKSMFSKQALSEADNFDGNLNALFDYTQGEIQSWKSEGAYTFPEERNADGSGNHKKEAESTYVFTTSKQKYHVAIYEYTIDTANPDNVGVYSLCIVNEKDNPDSEIVYWGDGKAGINIGK